MIKYVSDIILINTHLRDFWADGGWAPRNAAKILSRSRLDWQVSLSHSLKRWLDEPAPEESDGCIILAWAKLGSLVEGSLKWFLCVHQSDYACKPIAAPWGRRRGDPLDPDEPALAELIEYYSANIWTDQERVYWRPRLDTIRQRRNAVHAYQNRELGTWADFRKSVRDYRLLLLELEDCVPYPDAHFGYPSEVAALLAADR